MIPPQIAILLAKYGTILILIVSVVAGYYYWKDKVYTSGYNACVIECNESKEKFRIDAEHFKSARQEEVDKLKNEHDKRLQNAIKIYVAHYESQRNTPAATSLRVKTNTASTCSNTVPGTSEGGSGVTEGTARIGEAELPARNLQELNRVINDIERMELKCEQLLNSVP